MKKAFPGMAFLSACRLSAFGQKTISTNTKNEAPEDKADLPAEAVIDYESSTDMASFEQALQQISQKLDDSAAALVEAYDQVKINGQRLGDLDYEQTLLTLKAERDAREAEAQQAEESIAAKVTQPIEVGNQSEQLNRLRESLLKTEAGCKEATDQLALSMAS